MHVDTCLMNLSNFSLEAQQKSFPLYSTDHCESPGTNDLYLKMVQLSMSCERKNGVFKETRD